MGNKRGPALNSRGFTLIELLVVITIIITIAGHLAGTVSDPYFETPQDDTSSATIFRVKLRFPCDEIMMPVVNKTDLGFVGLGENQFPILSATPPEILVNRPGSLLPFDPNASLQPTPVEGQYTLLINLSIENSHLNDTCVSTVRAAIDPEVIFEQTHNDIWVGRADTGVVLNLIHDPSDLNILDLVPPNVAAQITEAGEDNIIVNFNLVPGQGLALLQGVTVGNGGEGQTLTSSTGGNESAGAGAQTSNSIFGCSLKTTGRATEVFFGLFGFLIALYFMSLRNSKTLKY